MVAVAISCKFAAFDIKLSLKIVLAPVWYLGSQSDAQSPKCFFRHRADVFLDARQLLAEPLIIQALSWSGRALIVISDAGL